ncbi:MAG TPA: alpha/beta fold hydrolase [Gemmatimonadaceae bacterium]|nr:alpha/beta fold hydrolase [Gemmatimonadaceae bacterium]
MVGLVAIAVAAALVWVAFTTFWMWRHQERVVFQPPQLEVQTPPGARRVEYPSADGAAVYGYVVAPSRPEPAPRAVVIAFHGNADLAAWFTSWARELADRAGVTVLLPEYRGYGGLRANPTYETAAADALGALSYARDSLRPSHVSLFGHSLGTAIASEVALTMQDGGAPPAALILQSPFTSAREMAARMLVPPIPWLWKRISRVHYETIAAVSRLDCPVWVAHGSRDVVVPVRMGRHVYAAAKRRGELLIVDGAGHNDVAEVGGDRYWRWLSAAVVSSEPAVSGR